ncbi:hypothetical protein [uncultured Thiohalocapsa sp.]|uniref:hypothetical protein n=1 Tax=uncultured Thiohalocapsa sp. TaxID=768990 RepID=UPI0025CFDCBE|nr:hypothetical protein [uncultured Thiohalocapsa sp.]
MIFGSITQPSYRTTSAAIQEVAKSHNFQALDVAASYITSSGLHDLETTLHNHFNLRDGNRCKRWLTSFDYLRTEPVALEALLAFPNSPVRIHEPESALANKGIPRRPFHPKAYLFRLGENLEVGLAGSGNLSRSGLSKGVEAGLIIGVDRGDPAINSEHLQSIDMLRLWFENLWAAGTPLNAALLDRYSRLYESSENLANPTAVEDDTVNSDPSTAAISAADLKKLRACRNFWVDAGNVTKNRGANLPGNQVMLKRMSRVFFGFAANNISENSHIGGIEISFDKGGFKKYSLTFSDNKMDKLVLPIPGDEGPQSYNNKILHFRAVGPRRFELQVFENKKLSSFRKKSKAVDGAFKMKSGREWGVF